MKNETYCTNFRSDENSLPTGVDIYLLGRLRLSESTLKAFTNERH